MGPNNQTMFSNLQATKDGTYFYYIILKDNFTETGDYSYTYSCGNSAQIETDKLEFEISYTGKTLKTGTVAIYLGSIFVLVFLFVLTLLLISKLPSKDSIDETGSILEINNLKHLRPVLWAVSWGIVLALMFIISNITIAFLPTYMIGNLFWAIYTIMFWITIAGLPLWFVWIFVSIFRDREFKRMIERGVDVKATP